MDEEAGLLRASRAKANVGRGRVLLALAVVLSVGGLAFAASRKATPNEFTNLGSTICPYNLEGGYSREGVYCCTHGDTCDNGYIIHPGLINGQEVERENIMFQKCACDIDRL